MKILNNTFPLHKLYGFLLLNTSLIVFMPAMLSVIGSHDLSRITIEMKISLALSMCGIILSILFILRKKIAVYLLTALLVTTILILIGYMFFALSKLSTSDVKATVLILNVFGFFIVEGIIGLLIIHSKKLSEEFESNK